MSRANSRIRRHVASGDQPEDAITEALRPDLARPLAGERAAQRRQGDRNETRLALRELTRAYGE